VRAPLERRLGRALVALGAALAVTYLVVVPQVAFKTEDAVFLRLMAAQLEQLHEDPHALMPGPMRRLSSWSGLEPILHRRLLQLPEGVHELNDIALVDGGVETDLFVGVARMGDPEGIVLHDVAELEVFDERIDAPGYYSLILIGAAVSLGLALAGFMAARRVFVSLGLLGRLIGATDSNQARAMIDGFENNEIGVLAQRLLEAREALDNALIRERRFTRDVSHELRTPVMIAAGAVELLERETGNTPRMRDLLARMRSAHARIEELIVTFLWLARSDRPDGNVVREPAVAVIQRVVQVMEQQAGRPLTEFVIRQEGSHDVVQMKPLGDLVLRNLLHNAIRHGAGGQVTVVIQPGEISIANAELPDSEPSTREHGFGQSIVMDLCGKLGWRIALERRVGQYTVRISTDSTDI
jgi:signal transduction histidine kinase